MFHLRSSAFREGETIPGEHTGDGADRSPPLEWSDPPDGTVRLALLCDDPDAPRGIWVHWILFNLPGETRRLELGVPSGESAAGGVHGRNDFGTLGYGGPAPPPGKPHRYFFQLYALDSALPLSAGATRDQLLAAMKGHVLAEAKLMGTYQR